jgi:secondary thiamine-phosphate synthase enzyme
MLVQKEFSLKPKNRGFHIITSEILNNLPELPENGLINKFIRHTSAALTINENYDHDVQKDLNSIFDKLVKEIGPYYKHMAEGNDDMPAHAKSTIAGASLSIPVSSGNLNLETWQGIYLCEFRNNGENKKIIAKFSS